MFLGLALVASLVAAPIKGGQEVAARAQETADSHQDTASDATDRQARTPTIIQVEPSPQEVAAAGREEAAHAEIFGLQPDAWVALFTFVLGVSTILLWLETRRLAKDGERSSGAAVKAANAAEKAANVAETALKAANRPIVAIQNLTLVSHAIGTPEQPWISFYIHNTGIGIAVIGYMRVYIALIEANGTTTNSSFSFADTEILDIVKINDSLTVDSVKWDILTNEVVERAKTGEVRIMVTVSAGVTDVLQNPYPFVMSPLAP